MSAATAQQDRASLDASTLGYAPIARFVDLVEAVESDAPPWYVQEALATLRRLGYEVKLLPTSSEFPGSRAGGSR